MPAPALLENVLRLLLPPATREHVLGDLNERYKSPKSYLIEAFFVLGPVIISRIRRTTDFQLFLIETFTVYLSFGASAWYLGQKDFLYGHSGLARLALPTSVAALGLLIWNAYSDPQRRSFSKAIVESGASICLAFLGQAIVFDTQPSLAVPFPVMLYGSLSGLLFVSTLRMLPRPFLRG